MTFEDIGLTSSPAGLASTLRDNNVILTDSSVFTAAPGCENTFTWSLLPKWFYPFKQGPRRREITKVVVNIHTCSPTIDSVLAIQFTCLNNRNQLHTPTANFAH